MLAAANLTLANLVEVFEDGAVSAANGTTLTLGSVSPYHMVFGSAGHAGVVVVGPLTKPPPFSAVSIEVAFGTLRNGAVGTNGLGEVTSSASSTSVDAGATLDVHDFNMEVANLLGAGVVTLGKSAATVLTVDAGNYNGVISGNGQLTQTTVGTLMLTGTNTYTGGQHRSPWGGGAADRQRRHHWQHRRQRQPGRTRRAPSPSTEATLSASPATSPAADRSPNMARIH